MSTNISKELAGKMALVTGGSCGIGAVTITRVAANGADVVSVFVTNGGFNGVQQVLRLSTPLWPPQTKPRRTSESDR
jgi:NAD(P)-dependent dehydrogenase (short-subunit alcohol dehydrogenase family)